MPCNSNDTWAFPENSADPALPPIATVLSHLSSHLFYEFKSPLEMQLLQQFQLQVAPAIVRPGWAPFLRDGWGANALRNRTTMEALLAISLLYQSRVVPERRFKAMQYYDSAISNLRHEITKFQSGDNEFELFTSAASCAYFEVRSRNSPNFDALD